MKYVENDVPAPSSFLMHFSTAFLYSLLILLCSFLRMSFRGALESEEH